MDDTKVRQFSLPFPFNTTEAWATVLAVVWAVLAHYKMLPAELAAGEFGTVGPALLLTGALVRVLGKLGQKGSAPFLPVVLAALLCVGLVAAPAMAQKDVPPFDWARLGIGAGGGVVTYDNGSGVADKTAGMAEGAVAYSLGKQLSGGAKVQYDFTNDWWTLAAGPRLLVFGTGTGEKAQLALGADYVHYYGPQGVVYADSWNAGLYGSYNVAGKLDDAVRWYITGSAVHDQKNARTTFGLGLRLAWTAYKSF